MKWIAPGLAYLAVGLGLCVFHGAWSALLGFHVSILAALFIARPELPVSILVKNKNNKWIFLSILLCGSSGVTLFLFWEHFGVAVDISTQLAALGLNSSTWLPFIAYFALVNPFIEEYFWRGYLGKPVRGLHISDALYAGFHALVLLGKVQTGSIIFALGMLIFAGWFWRQISREGGGLLAPVLGHMAADITILVTVYRMTS